MNIGDLIIGAYTEFKKLNSNLEKLIALYEKSEKSSAVQDDNEPSKQVIRLGDLYIKSDDSCSLLDFVRMVNHSVGREAPSK